MDLAPCGTPGAYRRHQRHREKIDDTCRAWYNANRSRLRSEGAGHLILVPGQIEPAGLCDCALNEAHWAPAEMSLAADRTGP